MVFLCFSRVTILHTAPLKETCYALFTTCNINPRMCLLSFSSKYPTDNLLHHFENAYFEWKQKHVVFMHVSLNANELLLPAPFPEWDCAFTAGTSCTLLKNTCLVLIIMYIALKSCILNHISLNLWYRVFWAHTSEAHAQKAAVTWHVSTKLSSLSCLIVLKLSNTHKFMLKTHEL